MLEVCYNVAESNCEDVFNSLTWSPTFHTKHTA